MTRYVALSAAIVLSAASLAAAQYRVRPPLPSDEAAGRYGLVRRWYAQVPIDGVREKVQRATVADGQVHLQTNASRVHVLDGETGQVLWHAQTGAPLPNHFSSGINPTGVFVVSTTRLYRLDRRTGSPVWSVRVPQVPSAAPAADEDQVVVSTAEGRIYVFDAETKALHWYYQSNAPISMPAVFIEDRIAVASDDGMVYVFKSDSRNPVLRYKTGGAVTAPLGAWRQYLLIPSSDYNLYAVNTQATAGSETKWVYPSGAEIRKPVSVVERQAFVTPENGGLHVLDAETGQRLWWYPRASDFIAASDDRVYATDRHGQLVILDRSTGRPLAVWNTQAFDFGIHNTSTDRVYLVTREGFVVALHEKEHADPLRHEVLPPEERRRPNLPFTSKPAQPKAEAAPMDAAAQPEIAEEPEGEAEPMSP